MTGDDAVRRLAEGELRVLGYMPRASNETFLAEITHEGGCTLAVYKPRDGESPLWDFPDGTLYRREVAAYLVSEALGWRLVPPTLVRDGPFGEGSVQQFVDFDPQHHYLTLAESHVEVFRRVAAFDLLVNNADRKSGHCLLERETGQVWCIDHGLTFHRHPKLRTVIWEFAGEPIPEAILAPIRTFVAEVLSSDGVEELRGLLAAGEVEALARRARRLIERPVFPAPGPGRPYPWPPV